MADLYEKSEYEEAGKKALNAYAYLKKMFGAEGMSDDEFQKLLIDEAKEYSGIEEDINIENAPSIEKNAELNNTKNVKNAKNIENVINITNDTNDKNINNININDATKEKEPIQNENASFVDNFLTTSQESANLQNISKTQEKPNKNEKNLNEENLNYFQIKSIQQKSNKQTKEAFKEEFKQYASQKMNADELKILVAILHKNPSRLNKEHKELIKESLALAQKNNTAYLHMDNAYRALIRTNLNQTISTQSVKDVIELFSSPKTELDKAVKKDSMSFTINTIKNLNKNSLAQETIAKLNNLINPINKTLKCFESGKILK